MIETKQFQAIESDIEGVWAYAKDMRKWASLMPGYRSCEVKDENDSTWVLKVGVGALIRTVIVVVHVEEWSGPDRVSFSFCLDGDPVTGRGSYEATRGGDSTDVVLTLSVQGSGPMAPVWEAMSRPLLPVMLKSFFGKLKAEIEQGGHPTEEAKPNSAAPRRLWDKFRKGSPIE